MLRKNSILSVIAILTMALGIGANTAIFSIVNSVLIQPLPYKNSDRLFTVHEFAENGQDERRWITRERYTAWQEENKSFEALEALHPKGFNVRIGKGTQRVQGAAVSSNFFSTLGVSPYLGHVLNQQNSERELQTVVLDYHFWQNNFGSDPRLIGQSIAIDNKAYVVTGILPKTFDYHYHQDIWIPLHFTNEELQTPGERSLHILALSRSNVTADQAQAELNAISSNLSSFESDRKTARMIPLKQDVVGDVRDSLLLFQVAVGFVLMIVCVNMTNLVLAQSSTREKEISIRLALGAGRGRLSLQFILESLLLSIIGGALGVTMFFWTRKMLLSAASIYLPFTALGEADVPVIGFAASLSIVSGVLIALIPAIQLTKSDFGKGLITGLRSSANRKSGLWRTSLVIAEVALSVILLIGAALMIKSLLRLQQIDPGFNPNQILKLRIALPETDYPEDQQKLNYYSESLERLKSLPGVESAAMINWLPFSQISNSVKLKFADQNPSLDTPEADIHVITPEYFRVMRIPVRKGRSFAEQDGVSEHGVIVVTETFIRRYFPYREAIGQVLRMDHNSMLFSGEIVGVVADVRNQALDIAPQPAVYVLQRQQPWQSIALREIVIRTQGDAGALSETAREAVWSIDRDVPVYQVQPMTNVLHRSLGTRRLNRNLISIFGFVALMLVVIGVYGLMSYSVAQRTQEIGIRMALGANRGNVLSLVLKHGFKIATAGIFSGVAGAIGLMRMMEKLLFGVSPLDWFSFAAIGLLIVLTILLASYLPARKAAKISPLIALRND